VSAVFTDPSLTVSIPVYPYPAVSTGSMRDVIQAHCNSGTLLKHTVILGHGDICTDTLPELILVSRVNVSRSRATHRDTQGLIDKTEEVQSRTFLCFLKL
jgi:hypothetical protein